MDAIIFDFDGVVVDSEPIHLRAFQEVLSNSQVELTADDYYTKYLGFDDLDCFRAVTRDQDMVLSQKQITALIAEKTAIVQRLMRESVRPLEGAVELLATAHEAHVPLAVCSGALRAEIELASTVVGVRDFFNVIIAGEDVTHGKPDPEGYSLALARLRRVTSLGIEPRRCLVVEDSPAGIEAARGAGMNVLAVTNSYPAKSLVRADRIVQSLSEVTIGELITFVQKHTTDPGIRS